MMISRFTKSGKSRALAATAALAILAPAMLTGCVSRAGSGGEDAAPLKKEDIQLVTVVQTSTNQYFNDWARGSQAFADSVGLPLKVIVSNGDSQQQLAQLQATVAAGKKVVVTVNPINSADVPALVKSVADGGGYITTEWNKPDDYKPSEVGRNYVAHLTYDSYAAGRWSAKQMFDAMGGKGGFVAFKGVLDSPPSQQRYAGMEQALKDYPGVTLLDTQSAKWDRQTAFDQTQSLTTKYGDQLTGVWAAGDSMALGAYAALQQAGKAAGVKVGSTDGTLEAFKEIQAGDNYVGSYSLDAYYHGAIGLALAYEAAVGGIDVEALSAEFRDGSYQRDGTYHDCGIDKSVGVSDENVADYITPPTDEEILSQATEVVEQVKAAAGCPTKP